MTRIDEIVGIARKARSLMTRDELVYLCGLADAAPDGTGVEIGVYCGASLIAWSLMREGRGLAIGVDNWAYVDRNGFQIDDLKGVCKSNLQAAGVTAQLIDGDSAEIAKTVSGDLAFVFIDGDHESPGVDQDIEAWTPKIVPGGIVAFHDYGRQKHNFAVTQAVDAWQAKAHWEMIGRSDSTVGFRRP